MIDFQALDRCWVLWNRRFFNQRQKWKRRQTVACVCTCKTDKYLREVEIISCALYSLQRKGTQCDYCMVVNVRVVTYLNRFNAICNSIAMKSWLLAIQQIISKSLSVSEVLDSVSFYLMIVVIAASLLLEFSTFFLLSAWRCKSGRWDLWQITFYVCMRVLPWIIRQHGSERKRPFVFTAMIFNSSRMILYDKVRSYSWKKLSFKSLNYGDLARKA